MQTVLIEWLLELLFKKTVVGDSFSLQYSTRLAFFNCKKITENLLVTLHKTIFSCKTFFFHFRGYD